MSNESPRRLARELVLKSIYAVEVGQGESQGIIEQMLKESGIGSKSQLFARDLFSKVMERRIWADRLITGLSEHWDIERMARIDRDILRIALVELEELPDIPVKVVLNEAIELAKRYSTAESSRFINGLLDRHVKNSPSLQSDTNPEN